MYDNPLTVTYCMDIDFGAAVAESIQGPDGSSGVIRHISICNVTEVFAGVNAVNIGNSGDADAYVSFTPSTIADGGSEDVANTDGPSGNFKNRIVAADTQILIAASAATTGQGTLVVVIDWNDPMPRPDVTP